MYQSTISPARTITFGDVAENGPGMQHIGKASGVGLTRADIEFSKSSFEELGVVCEIIDLRLAANGEEDVKDMDSACILIVRGGGGALCYTHKDQLVEGNWKHHATILETEQSKLEPDRKAWMRGRVVNKLARWNLCFGDNKQEADLTNRKGTIVPFSSLPILSTVRDNLSTFFGGKAHALNAELNVYYDPRKCGIGFHGDAERFVTIGIRLGVSIPFQYQWFKEGKPFGERVNINLEHGDLYAMGAKAVGTDWKRRKIPTLRHAAGCMKFTTIKDNN